MRQQQGHHAANRSKLPRGGAVRTSAMFGGFFKSDEAGKTRKRYQKRVDEVNSFESQFQGMSDEELKAQTPQLQQRAQEGEALESLLPEAFAVRHSHSCVRNLSYGPNIPVRCIPRLFGPVARVCMQCAQAYACSNNTLSWDCDDGLPRVFLRSYCFLVDCTMLSCSCTRCQADSKAGALLSLVVFGIAANSH